MITGAVIGFLIYSCFFIFGLFMHSSDDYELRYGRLITFYLLFIGVGASIGYLFS